MPVDSVKSPEFDVAPSDYSTGSKATTALGKDEFLNLLVKQMQYQDPLEPSTDTEFISQMAQFSSLEQMQNLNDTFSTFQAYSMVGKYATANYGMETLEGYVENVYSAGGTTYAVIDGTTVDVGDIYKVTDMAEELQVLTSILQQLVDSKNEAPKDEVTNKELLEKINQLTDRVNELAENSKIQVDTEDTSNEENSEVTESVTE